MQALPIAPGTWLVGSASPRPAPPHHVLRFRDCSSPSDTPTSSLWSWNGQSQMKLSEDAGLLGQRQAMNSIGQPLTFLPTALSWLYPVFSSLLPSLLGPVVPRAGWGHQGAAEFLAGRMVRIQPGALLWALWFGPSVQPSGQGVASPHLGSGGYELGVRRR